jgi:hypothetical protein
MYRDMREDGLSKHERENLLIKLGKEFAFAGATIPAEVEADGERIRLRAYVLEMAKKRGGLSLEEAKEAGRVIALITKKRREVVSRIASEEMTAQQGKGLYRAALGLDRALDTLYSASLPKPSYKEESMRAKREGEQRWLDLIKKVYARQDSGKRG